MHTGPLPGGRCHAVISSVNVCLKSFALLYNWFLYSNMSGRKVVKLKLMIMNM